MNKSQKHKYRKLFDDGMTWQEVADVINNELGKSYTKTQVRDRLKRVVLMDSDDEEYKSRYEWTEDGYRIFYGKSSKDYVDVTEKELIEAFSLYTYGGLNIDQVTLRMKWTRAQFYAIKSAFSITKTTDPLTPRQIDNHTTDELQNILRVTKLRFVREKYEANKHKDIERRIKIMDEVDYWFNQLIEKSNKIDIAPYQQKPFVPSKEFVTLVDITDVHSGLDVKNALNVYNIDIMRESFNILYSEIVRKVPKGTRLIICDLGDSVHGKMHKAVYKYGGFMVNATFEYQVCMGNFLVSLVVAGYYVEFGKVDGSHSTLSDSKDGRTEEDNMGRFIFNNLRWKLGDLNNLEFIDKVLGFPVTIVKVFDFGIALTHGDASNMKGLSGIDRLFRKHNIIEVHSGHIHHKKTENFNGVTVYYNEPMCGTDQHAASKLLSSEKGTRIVQYTKEGRGQEWLVRY